MLEFNLDKVIKEITAKKAKVIAVQIPEGLKTSLTGIVSKLEKETGAKAISFVSPCYGACDLKDREAKEMGAEVLIHFGHTKFVAKEELATVYIPMFRKPDGKKAAMLAEKIATLLKEKKINAVGMCSTAQFKPYRELVEKNLKEKGINTFTGKGINVEKGQVLGCNYTSVKAIEKESKAVVFVGDGLFHPIGLSFAVERPVLIADPIEAEVKELGKQRDLFLRKRIAMIEKSKQAKSVAIWISSKTGQRKAGLAVSLKEKFEKKGKKAFVFASDLLNSDYIAGIEVEAIVSTACPRIALDDSSQFKQPIINPAEALVVLGEKKLEEYEFDELT